MASHLFVYGTLLSAEGHPARRALERHAERVGEGWVQGRLHDCGAYPAATRSPDPGDRITGEVYAIRAGSDAAVFAALDPYEDCRPPGEPPGLFRRELIQAHCEARGAVRAWIYLYNRDPAGLPRIESGSWLAHRRGAGR